MITVCLPLFVDLPRKKGKPKRIYTSLNVYRNLNHHIKNDTKHIYKDLIWLQLAELPVDTKLITPCEVTITLYAPDKRERDLGNFCSIAQKYCDDAIVEFGLLPDDCTKYIKRCVYCYGGVDANNPRFEVVYSHMN